MFFLSHSIRKLVFSLLPATILCHFLPLLHLKIQLYNIVKLQASRDLRFCQWPLHSLQMKNKKKKKLTQVDETIFFLPPSLLYSNCLVKMSREFSKEVILYNILNHRSSWTRLEPPKSPCSHFMKQFNNNNVNGKKKIKSF